MAQLSWFQMARVTATGALFAFNAGFTNAVTLCGLYGRGVSQITGSTAALARTTVLVASGRYDNATADYSGSSSAPGYAGFYEDYGAGDDSAAAQQYGDYGGSTLPSWVPAFHGAPDVVVLAGFLIGAMASGTLVGPALRHRLKLASRYGVGLVVESVLLALTLVLIVHSRLGGLLFGALALGLQNGLITMYSGALLRSTNLTGLWTDIGVLIGQLIHQIAHSFFGDPENKVLVKTELWRFRFLVPTVVGYVGGSALGGLAYFGSGDLALIVPIAVTFSAGIAVLIYNWRRHALAQRKVQERVYASLRSSTKRSSKPLASSDDDINDERESVDDPGAIDQTLAEVLAARGDWDALQYTMQIRNAARHAAMAQYQQQPHDASHVADISPAAATTGTDCTTDMPMTTTTSPSFPTRIVSYP